MTDTLERLKQTVAETSTAQVAKRIGVSRTAVSLVVNDKYPANPQKIFAAYDAAYGGVTCPYLAVDITREQCRDYATKDRPSNPLGLAHWKACKNCSFRGA